MCGCDTFYSCFDDTGISLLWITFFVGEDNVSLYICLWTDGIPSSAFRSNEFRAKLAALGHVASRYVLTSFLIWPHYVVYNVSRLSKNSLSEIYSRNWSVNQCGYITYGLTRPSSWWSERAPFERMCVIANIFRNHPRNPDSAHPNPLFETTRTGLIKVRRYYMSELANIPDSLAMEKETLLLKRLPLICSTN